MDTDDSSGVDSDFGDLMLYGDPDPTFALRNVASAADLNLRPQSPPPFARLLGIDAGYEGDSDEPVAADPYVNEPPVDEIPLARDLFAEEPESAPAESTAEAKREPRTPERHYPMAYSSGEACKICGEIFCHHDTDDESEEEEEELIECLDDCEDDYYPGSVLYLAAASALVRKAVVSFLHPTERARRREFCRPRAGWPPSCSPSRCTICT